MAVCANPAFCPFLKKSALLACFANMRIFPIRHYFCLRASIVSVCCGAFLLSLIFGTGSVHIAYAQEVHAPVAISDTALVQPTEDAQPLDIVADSIEHERERDLYIARGNVKIVQGARTLTADWVSFSNTTRKGVATGNVVVSEGPDQVNAQVLSFNIDTLRGTVFDGWVDSEGRGFRMAGAKISKTDAQKYEIEDAKFTTCRCPEGVTPDPWQIRAEKAKVEVEGYGTMRNSTFDVLGVPVVWLPWMIYPVKTERSTGFLFPTLSSDEVAFPFFWAARDNINLTFVPEFDFERGFHPGVDLEYVFGERSEGELYLSYIHDQDVSQGEAKTPYSDDRWAAQWTHDQFLPQGWRLKSNVTSVSDNDYVYDFHDLEGDLRSNRFLESQVFLTKRFGKGARHGFVADVAIADDLQNPDDDDRDSAILQQLPNLSWIMLPHETPIPFVITAMDTSYTYFRAWKDSEKAAHGLGPALKGQFYDTGVDGIADPRERDEVGVRTGLDPHGDSGFGGTEGDGIFQEGELLADRGHRVMVNPRIGAPIRLFDAIEFYPEIGYHQTFYSSRFQGSDARGLLTARMDLRTRLRGEFALPFSSQSVTHFVEPRVGYVFVQGRDQDDNPLFVPDTALPQNRVRQFATENITRDSADRIGRFHGVFVGVGNRFFASGKDGARLFGELDLSAQYNFPGSTWGLVAMQGSLYPIDGMHMRFITSYDLDENRVDEGMLQVGFSSQRGDDLDLTYRYRRDIPLVYEDYPYLDRFHRVDPDYDRIHQISLNGRWAIDAQWALVYDADYAFVINELLKQRAGVEYISRCRCWAVQVAISDHRNRGPRFDLRYTLMGLGQDPIRPFSRETRSNVNARKKSL